MKETLHIKRLTDALGAENAMSRCCGHLAGLIRNGKIRSSFLMIAETARNNERVLQDRLEKMGIEDFIPEERCKLCKIQPESFSLSGALNLGTEVANVVIRFYKDLLSFAADNEDRELFNSLIKEKTRQLDFLKREKKFIHKEEQDDFNAIDSHCMNEVISKLWI